MQQKSTTKHGALSKQISWAILGAMAFILMQFEFPIIPALPYLKMDLSDVIVTLSAFIVGPVGAVCIALVKAGLDFFIKGANLMTLVGDVAAFSASISFALPVYYVLKDRVFDKKIVRKILGFIAGTLVLTLVLSVLNYFVITPMYITLAGFKLSMSLMNYILYAVVPFNLVKGLILSIVSGLLFVSVLPVLKKYVDHQR